MDVKIVQNREEKGLRMLANRGLNRWAVTRWW
jgi:hypothetical protein